MPLPLSCHSPAAASFSPPLLASLFSLLSSLCFSLGRERSWVAAAQRQTGRGKRETGAK